VNKCMTNAQDMKREILKALEKFQEATHLGIAKDIFNFTDPSTTRTLSLIVWHFLKYLAEEGVISLDEDAQIARLK
jgi:hypothetical protein